MSRPRVDSRKVQVTLSPEVYDKVCAMAEKEHTSKSAICAMATKQYLESVIAMPSAIRMMESFASVMERFADMKPEERASALDALEAEAKSIQQS